MVPQRVPGVDPAHLARWCLKQLGSPPAAELFTTGNLSAVTGLRLADGREVVVKVRPASPRVVACTEVQRRLFGSGYPCPEPLSAPAPLGSGMATAEAYVPGGAALPDTAPASRLSGRAFARLIEAAPRPADVPPLVPAPSWAAWDHPGPGLWPRPDESDVDLNQAVGPEWIDQAGLRARDRLRTGPPGTAIGHTDWLAGNVRWSDDKLLVVHDWDSVAVGSEAVLAGFAAAQHATASPGRRPTARETSTFLDAYGDARGRPLSTSELQLAWAAGAWTLAYDAKYQHATGVAVTLLSPAEARDRLHRAGITG